MFGPAFFVHTGHTLQKPISTLRSLDNTNKVDLFVSAIPFRLKNVLMAPSGGLVAERGIEPIHPGYEPGNLPLIYSDWLLTGRGEMFSKKKRILFSELFCLTLN